MKLNENTKAQAALEFLTTYGWAIMVVMVMVAAMAYYGVINPTKYLPERCTFGVQLLCEDHVLRINPAADEGYVEFVLMNSMGQRIEIDSATAKINQQEMDCEVYSDKTYNIIASEFDDQKRMYFRCNGVDPGFVAEQKTKVQITIKYIKEVYSKPLYGEIYASPQ